MNQSETNSLDAARERVRAAYDPRLIETSGRKLAEVLARHLRSVQQSESVVLNWADPRDSVTEAAQTLSSPLPAESPAETVAGRFAELARLALSRGINLHDPRYVGHQVPAPVPIAGLFDALGSVTNQPMAIYEMGPWATAVERVMIDELAKCIGWAGTDYAGIVTHGASLANLTALLVARNVALPESWEQGVACTAPQATSESGALRAGAPVLVVQSDAHYCIARSAGILGLGTNQVVKAALDERRRMDPAKLDESLTELRNSGHRVVAVAACACATPIGAFDPLNAIADVCAKHGVWLHVDAAHGGAALLSKRHRHQVAGLERADSLTWDAHKMLFVPALCAFLFYKNGRHSYEAFKQNAPYLFDPSAPGLAEFDSGLRTVECTKRAASFGLWGVWSLFGSQLFADMVDVTFDLGRILYEKLQEAADFIPLHDPECNIVVFRHVPAALKDATPQQIGEFQWQLRRAVIESGEFYLVPTIFQGVAALRVTLINPLTTAAHLDGLLDCLRRHGKQLL